MLWHITLYFIMLYTSPSYFVIWSLFDVLLYCRIIQYDMVYHVIRYFIWLDPISWFFILYIEKCGSWRHFAHLYSQNHFPCTKVHINCFSISNRNVVMHICHVIASAMSSFCSMGRYLSCCCCCCLRQPEQKCLWSMTIDAM